MSAVIRDLALPLALRLPAGPLTGRIVRRLCRMAGPGMIPTRQGYAIYWNPKDGGLAQTLRALAAAGEYDPDYFAAIRSLVPAGGIAVDVGAHEGFVSLLLADVVGASGRVIAVEPNPENVTVLERNLTHNIATNVEIVDAAMDDREGTVTLYRSLNEGAWGSLDAYSFHHPNAPVTVRATTLDAELMPRDLPRLDFLKVDTEGRELEVFRGGG